MAFDPNELMLDELEVSVRTSNLLRGLRIRTLGELLELPSITATRAVIGELREVFAELGVTYPGELRVKDKTRC